MKELKQESFFMKRFLCLVLAFLFTTGLSFAAKNYTYQKAAVKYNTREAYNEYAEQINDAVYKNMPRSFSYINREPQFAISVKSNGELEKAWILVSSGSKGYDKKVIKRMEKAEFPAYKDYVSAKNLVFRYKIRKRTKIIPIPIPIWF